MFKWLAKKINAINEREKAVEKLVHEAKKVIPPFMYIKKEGDFYNLYLKEYKYFGAFGGTLRIASFSYSNHERFMDYLRELIHYFIDYKRYESWLIEEAKREARKEVKNES